MDTWIVLSVLQALAGAPALAGETVQRQPEDSAVIRRSLDGAWFFRKDPKGEGLEQGWHSEAISDSRWSPIRVPGHWEPQGHKGYDGVGWYRRTFDVPAADGAGRWGLCLLGVDDRARVWVNGQEVGAISQAFRRFAVDVTGVVRAGSNTLAVRVEDAGGDGGIVRSVYLGRSEELDALLRGPHHGKPARASANWVRDAVIYEVYLRSFSTEGTFKGLEHRLDELKNLGVTVLWLMPVHPVGQVKRKGTLGSPYSVKDFYAVNDEFGRMEDFKSLLSAVHQRGMKLIIDWVANHTAWDNPLVTQHPDWYHRDEQGQIRPPVPDWSDVAHLDYSKQAVRRYMADALLYWVRDVGIDGFRCDVAGMVPLDFWQDVRGRLDAVKPVMMLAEDDKPAQHLHAFDLTYDWDTYRVMDRLKEGRLPPEGLAGVLSEEAYDFPAGALRMRFSSNHDMCAWHQPGMQRYGPQAAKTAAVLTFTLPGVPLIYTGQEAGNRTKLSLFERVPVDWITDDRGMRAFLTELARVRRQRASLRRGKTRLLDGPAQVGVLGMLRYDGAESTYVLINLTGRVQRVSCGQDLPEGLATLFGNATVGQDDRGTSIELPPLGYWIGG